MSLLIGIYQIMNSQYLMYLFFQELKSNINQRYYKKKFQMSNN